MFSLQQKWLQYGSLIGFLICAGIFFSWNWVKTLFPGLSQEALIGIWIACIYGLLIYFSGKLNEVLAALGDLQHLSLSEAIRRAIGQKSHVKHFRVLAVTSAKILPIIHGTDIKLDECTLLLPFFADAPKGSREEHNNARVLTQVQDWKSLEKAGRVKVLKIFYCSYWPSFYCCLFDDEALLSGLYVYNQPQSEDPLTVDYSEPFLITPGSTNHGRMIEKYRRWFDESVTQSRPSV